MDWVTAAGLAGAGLLGGLVDSVVGGGGVVTLPAYLVAGLPPAAAVATNKLSATVGSATATLVFARRGHLDSQTARTLAVPAALAAVGGAALATRVDPHHLRLLVVVAVVAITAWVLTRRGEPPPRAGGPARWRAWIGTVAVGAYDGLLGPGTGIFFFAIQSGLMGFDFRTAAGNGRALNLATNLGALALFATVGLVQPLPALAVAAGVAVGSQVGSRLAVTGGAGFIKPVLAAVAVLLVIRLLSGG